MSKVLVSESNLTAIANSIRNKTGKTSKLKPGQMSEEIDSITGGGDTNIKLFSSIEAMNSDDNPKEGGLALVYDYSAGHPSSNDLLNFIQALQSVKFDTAITDNQSLSCWGSNGGLMIDLSTNGCTIQVYQSAGPTITITYTSNDGITYITEDDCSSLYNIGRGRIYSFNSNTAQFINNIVCDFNGFYRYETDRYVLAPNQLTALEGQILNGRTAYTNNGVTTGTMVNRGSLNITPSTSTQTLQSGYISGGTVKAVTSDIDENIVSDNIAEGVSILGVQGILPTVIEHKYGIGYDSLITSESTKANYNCNTMYNYTSTNGGSITLPLLNRDGDLEGILTGEEVSYVYNKELNKFENKTSLSIPNFRFDGYTSLQNKSIIMVGTWKANRCKLYYIPYGSAYSNYVRVVTLTKNASGQIVYDSSLPKWEIQLPLPDGYKQLINAQIVIDPRDDNYFTIASTVDHNTWNSTCVGFTTLKLNSYSGTGWGSMTASDIILVKGTSGRTSTDETRFFRYINDGKLIVYGNLNGAYNCYTQVLFTDTDKFAKWRASITQNVNVFNYAGTKCIVGSTMYNMNVDYTNHTVTLINPVSISVTMGRNMITDRYDMYIFRR